MVKMSSTSVNGGQVDAGTRMSVQFQISVNTQRAERELASVDDAIRRLGRLGKQSHAARGRSGVALTTKSKYGKSDTGYMVALVAISTERIETKAEAALRGAVELGAMLVKITLETARTGWGEYRMSLGQGRSAGRDDSGKMIDAVDWNVSKAVSMNVSRRGATIRGGTKSARLVGWFGWDKPENYMVAQEKGFRHSRGSSGGFEKKVGGISKADTGLNVEGAMSLGRAMLSARGGLINYLKGK